MVRQSIHCFHTVVKETIKLFGFVLYVGYKGKCKETQDTLAISHTVIANTVINGFFEFSRQSKLSKYLSGNTFIKGMAYFLRRKWQPTSINALKNIKLDLRWRATFNQVNGYLRLSDTTLHGGRK